jgi:membrane associated rhomboid family serine protease
MIPLRSSERTYSPATVTITLIAINLVVFFYEFFFLSDVHYRDPFTGRVIPSTLDAMVMNYGLVPDQFSSHPYSLLTSMFLHAGWLHVLGNMWFLWIFGKAVEDLLGHTKFLIFYLVCGVAAGLVHVFASLQVGNTMVPTVGASGAIAGVMGAYLIKFPRARVVTLIFVFIFITTIDIPAAFLLIYWFLIQFYSGVGSLHEASESGGGVAWFAHIGGFIAGMVLVALMPARQRFQRWYPR